LKYHGGVEVKDLNRENLSALALGMENIKKHIENLTQHLGLKVLVAINHFYSDTQAEINYLQQTLAKVNVNAILCQHWEKGGEGALELANQVLSMTKSTVLSPHFLYDASLSIKDKIFQIATKFYGARHVDYSEAAQNQLNSLEAFSEAYAIGHFPVCIAKSQYSFSSDPNLRGAPSGHTLNVREVRLAHGAGFIVAICGDVMTMPGLPIHPASEHIDINNQGNIVGLS
jgi:formate--tetrahydrofolate ligase